MKSAWSMITAAAMVIAVLVYLSSTAKKAPYIPIDSIHGILTSQEACVACHTAGKAAPLKADHPLKEQCLLCHKVKKI